MQGQSYVFSLPASMQADITASRFLEATQVASLHGSGLFGISYDGLKDVAATGALLKRSSTAWITCI